MKFAGVCEIAGNVSTVNKTEYRSFFIVVLFWQTNLKGEEILPKNNISLLEETDT